MHEKIVRSIFGFRAIEMSAEAILPAVGGEASGAASVRSEDSDSGDSETTPETSCHNLDTADFKICAASRSDGKRRQTNYCGPKVQCVLGITFIVLSVMGLIFTPLDFMLWEKLNMRPGLPPYDWWADPPDEVKLRVYAFNITNHDRFMQGLDPKLNVEEIGPIVYLEKLVHTGIKFNENSTMTYVAKRHTIYLPDENNVDMNATLIVPNLAVLGIASYLHNSMFFIQSAFTILASSYGSELFVKKTVHQYLWDFREPVLDLSKNLAPGLVPVNNMGILARIYGNFQDEMTVKIGPRWGHDEFFQIDRFWGNPQLPGYDPEVCPDRIAGSTEGVMYRQRLTKNDTLLYWRKTVCKIMPLYFDSEMTLEGVPVYRYNLSESVHERLTNGTDCYASSPTLPDGVSDASKCYYNFPMVSSYPHFYAGGVLKDQFVTGLKPDRIKHNSYVIVEPLTGTPFHSVARMQSNLHIRDLSGFSYNYDKLSNLILPLFWAEYNQENLPSKIKNVIYFMVVILPPLTIIVLSIIIILGFYLIAKNVYETKLRYDKIKTLLHFNSDASNVKTNTIFNYEKETFLKSPS